MMESHMSLLFMGGHAPGIPSHISSVSLPGRLHSSSASTSSSIQTGTGGIRNHHHHHEKGKEQHRRSSVSSTDSALTEPTSSGSSVSGASSWLSRLGIVSSSQTPASESNNHDDSGEAVVVDDESTASMPPLKGRSRIPPSSAFPVHFHIPSIEEDSSSSSTSDHQQPEGQHEEQEDSLHYKLPKKQLSVGAVLPASSPRSEMTRPQSSSFRGTRHHQSTTSSSSYNQHHVSFHLATQIHESAMNEEQYTTILAELQREHHRYLDETMVQEYIQQLTWYDSDTIEHWHTLQNLQARAAMLSSSGASSSCWEPIQTIYQHLYRLAKEYFQEYHKEISSAQPTQQENNTTHISAPPKPSLCWAKAYLYSNNTATPEEWETLRTNLRQACYQVPAGGLWGLEHVGMSTVCRKRPAVAMARGRLASLSHARSAASDQWIIEGGACQLLAREMAEAQALVLYEEQKASSK